MIDIGYGIICAAMLVILLFLYGYCIHALWISRRRPPGMQQRRWPRVALIIPCKGLDPDLREHLRRHFHHDYLDYRIVFSVADAADPACKVIEELIQTETNHPAALVIAPRLPDCVEKASNQVAALRSLGPDVEVIVCADSDGLPRDRDWMRALVAGLDHCSLVSGFRWYIPASRSFTGYLQSAFDSAWCLLHALGKTTWGGAMAFRRDTCERQRFEDHLARAITDDLALQACTHRAGERTGFAPGGMVISQPAEHFGDFFRWAVRQSQLVRLVTPWIWLMGFAAANVYAAFFLASVALLVVPERRSVAGIALGIAALLYLGRALLTYRVARALLPDQTGRTSRLRWVYYWAIPLADLLAAFVAHTSWFSRTIRWRAVHYRIKKGRVVRI
jgi:cellulose synthase/poly-beta-1,6-N-acetylglucosamine synthase-like glycosyltransferase